MDLISILVAAAAVVLAAALSAAATVFVVRRLVPPEARSLVFEREPAAAGVPEKRLPGRGRPAPLPELPGPLRPGAAHRPDPALSLYVKPGRQARGDPDTRRAGPAGVRPHRRRPPPR